MIDADLLKERDGFGLFAWNTIVNAPTVEAVPVVHGNFMFDLYGEFAQCNRCFEEFEAEYANTYKFCPNCGAKMDGD